jgi:hypothetical protein
MKPQRIVNEDLLEAVRNLICMACASTDPAGAREAMYENKVRSHPHHVISKGAGGHDVAENVMPLCHAHHREIHQIGEGRMGEKYKVVADWLEGARNSLLHQESLAREELLKHE